MSHTSSNATPLGQVLHAVFDAIENLHGKLQVSRSSLLAAPTLARLLDDLETGTEAPDVATGAIVRSLAGVRLSESDILIITSDLSVLAAAERLAEYGRTREIQQEALDSL